MDTKGETYKFLYETKSGILYMSVGHSLILPWTHTYKLIERPHFLGTSGIGVKTKSVPEYC